MQQYFQFNLCFHHEYNHSVNNYQYFIVCDCGCEYFIFINMAGLLQLRLVSAVNLIVYIKDCVMFVVFKLSTIFQRFLKLLALCLNVREMKHMRYKKYETVVNMNK